MKKVMLFGSFDLLHPGHDAIFSHAKELGDVHVVVARDETIQKIKGRLPFHTLDERITHLETYGITVHAGDATDRLASVKEVQPDIFLLGYDQEAFVDKLEAYVANHPGTEIQRMPAFKEQLFSSRRIRRLLEDPNAQCIIIDKPSGENSMKTVSILRKKLNIRRIGFAGTLDPLASGLLVCGISGATTLLDWWHEFPKTYTTTIVFGKESETYDADGPFTDISDLQPEREALENAVKRMIGSQKQEPPMYSAKKVDGKRLYSLARKGKRVERKKNAITVIDALLQSYTYPSATLSITCSTGTYIRSLVHDLGKELGVGAYVETLRRVAIGPYREIDAHDINALDADTIRKKAVPFEKLLEHLRNQYAV